MNTAANPAKIENNKSFSRGILDLYGDVISYQLHYPLLTILLFTGIGIGILYECLVPLIFKWLFNVVLPNKSMEQLTLVAILIFISFCLLAASLFSQAHVNAKLGSLYTHYLRAKTFKKVQTLSLDKRTREYESAITSFFDSDINYIESVATYIMWMAFRAFIMSLVGGALLFYFDWRMALLVAFTIPITLILPRIFSRQTNEKLKQKRLIESQLLAEVNQSVGMQQIIRILRLHKYFGTKFAELLKKAAEIDYKYNVAAGLVSRTAYLDINLVKLLALITGAYLVITNRLAPGTLIAFILLLGSVNNSMTSLTSLYPLLNRAIHSLTNIKLFLAEKQIVHSGERKLSSFNQSIRMENVTFMYDGKASLSNINLTLAAGQMVAIVGPSGAGKTTLMKLLLQEIKPQMGTLTIDGSNLYEISSNSLFEQIGMVLQSPSLFNMTISENIRMGKLSATMDEIIAAAKKAQIHEDIIKLPLQYDTEIGLRNIGVSQGQSQRISIARALIADPKILLLDEATSSLDPFSGGGIDEMLFEMKGQYTILLITHRLSSAVKADKIYVLKQGEFVESGTHEQLIAQSGYYKELWDKQNSFVMAEDVRHLAVVPTWLQHIPFFSSLRDDELNQLANELLFETVDANTIVFKQGDPGSRFYILLSGEVAVIKSDSTGNDVEVGKLAEGDYFGEVALLLDVPRTATIKTTSFCIFLTLHYQQFAKFFKSLSKSSQDLLMTKIREYK